MIVNSPHMLFTPNGGSSPGKRSTCHPLSSTICRDVGTKGEIVYHMDGSSRPSFFEEARFRAKGQRHPPLQDCEPDLQQVGLKQKEEKDQGCIHVKGGATTP